ncbi:MAG: SH3 domain-containing protein [Bacillota bacterium]|nr:SH3 domain-containing protein [Bacillota bacterium]
MDIDKILENWGESHNASEKVPVNIKERCWSNIKAGARKSWYESVLAKLFYINRRYHMKLAVQIAFVIALVFCIPTLIKTTSNFVQKSAFFNNHKDNHTNTVIDDRREYKSDPDYLKALEKVKEFARTKYNKFSIYSDGEAQTLDSKTVYSFRIYENLTDSKQKPEKTEVNVDISSLAVVEGDQYGNADAFYSNNEDLSPSQEPQKLNKWRTAVLINLADKLNYKTINEALKNIKYDKLPWDTKGNKEIVKGSSFYCESQPDIYYNYDESSGKLYKYDMNTNEKKAIYDYNTDKFNILNLEKKEDMDGDGKADEIRFNILNGVLSINGEYINTVECSGLLDFNIVDLDKSDGHKEVYLRYFGEDDTNTHLFFNYEQGTINAVGLVQHGEPTIDGSGKAVFKNTLTQFFETSAVDMDYRYFKDNVLRIQPKDMYEMANINGDNNKAGNYQIIKAKKKLNIYKEKDSKEVSAVLAVGEEVKLIGSDLKNWVLVENSKGVRGWFQVDGIVVKELNLPSYDVFDKLNFAG